MPFLILKVVAIEWVSWFRGRYMRPPRLEDDVDHPEDSDTALHVPTAPSRPGDNPVTPAIDAVAGELDRPDPSCAASETHEHAHGMIRVLDENGDGVGPWNPKLSNEVLKEGLRQMVRMRVFDDRMMTMQRQGKLSFYM